MVHDARGDLRSGTVGGDVQGHSKVGPSGLEEKSGRMSMASGNGGEGHGRSKEAVGGAWSA